MAETEEFVVGEVSLEDAEKERQKLMEELIRTFLPNVEEVAQGATFAEYYDACKAAARARIEALIAEGNLTKAYLLLEMYQRVYDQNVIFEKGSGYNLVRVTFNRSQGTLRLDTQDEGKQIILGKHLAAQIIQDFLYKVKEVIDPDDFLFI